jgi:hypothetical protein
MSTRKTRFPSYYGVNARNNGKAFANDMKVTSKAQSPVPKGRLRVAQDAILGIFTTSARYSKNRGSGLSVCFSRPSG